jgi:hypothetical protein
VFQTNLRVVIIIVVRFELLSEHSQNSYCIAGIRTQQYELTSCSTKAAQNKAKSMLESRKIRQNWLMVLLAIEKQVL